MRNFLLPTMTAAALLFGGSYAKLEASSVSVAIVDVRKCAEHSKMGKQEQKNVRELTDQVQKALEDKKKAAEDLHAKLEDQDYIDSITPEEELKQKQQLQAMIQEFMQLRQEYAPQAMQQAQGMYAQKMGQAVSASAKRVAKDRGYDVVLNSDSSFYFKDSLEITSEVILDMNTLYDQQIGATSEAEKTEVNDTAAE